MGKRKSGLVTQVSSRKAQRKEQRQLKKKKKKAIAHAHHQHADATTDENQHQRRQRRRSESGDNLLEAHANAGGKDRKKESDKKHKKSLGKKRKSSDANRSADAPDVDPYAHLDPAVAAALRADDAEINDLEARLGVGSSSTEDRKRLNKEYAKLEGYGDDFGEFLYGLDDMVGRLGENSREGGGDDDDDAFEEDFEEAEDFGEQDDDGDASSDDDLQRREKKAKTEKEKKRKKSKKSSSDKDLYTEMDPETAAALRAEDAEIKALEEKLGLKSGKKQRKKLNKEYAKLEGYGDDFGDFLQDLDGMAGRLAAADGNSSSDDDGSLSGHDNDSFASSDGEELVPMKKPAMSDEEEDFDDDFLARYEVAARNEKLGKDDGSSDDNDEASDSGSDSDSNSSSSDGGGSDDDGEDDEDVEDKAEPDHDARFTYRPSAGEDLYGNRIDSDKDLGSKPTKYVPPHLRKKMAEEEKQNEAEPNAHGEENQKMADDPKRQESLRMIRRSLNNVLNRLSEQMLESVAKSIAGLYRSYPTHDVNECFLSNLRNACVPQNLLMSGLIPIYVACASGVHFQTGDDVQLGGYMLEHIVLDLLSALEEARKGDGKVYVEEDLDGDDSVVSNKKSSNLVLILCYLYNFGVVHCALVYDIIRELIENFTEIDVETLLLILSHCGYQLRSDDPAALKDIVLLVQNKALEIIDEGADSASKSTVSSSRVQYMISAMTDLKNNKRRKKDEALGRKTAAYRKIIGRIKATSANVIGRSSDASLRIRLQDIKDIESKGRWWKVGAKWRGNQFHDGTDEADGTVDEAAHPSKSRSKNTSEQEEDALLAMASKFRMNTDLRRSIFCIIMGSTDMEDAFEKLVRGGMLKGKSERDVVRVLTECCSQEKGYNPYYAHLANRICEYQPSCNFTLRLTYWDAFKQFDNMKARKAANLAKLLAHLLTNGQGLNLSVLKVIDIDSNGMPEKAIIFLMVLFTTLFETFDDPLQVKHMFEGAFAKRRRKNSEADDDNNFNDDEDGLKEGLSLFLLQYLKSSPKNVKKSKFRANFKAAVKACETDELDSMMAM